MASPLRTFDIVRVAARASGLGALESYVLSCVDQPTTVLQLALATGVDVEQLLPMLQRLVDRGIVEIVPGGVAVTTSPTAPRPSTGAVTKTSPLSVRSGRDQPSPPTNTSSQFGAQPLESKPANSSAKTLRGRPRTWSTRLLDDSDELSLEIKVEVLDLYQDLEHLDYFELLGVSRAADRKAIKNAYYALAARFHPDRYFGKQLGHYKAWMEAVFARLTLAHDTLTVKERREEYEAYLIERDRTRAFERYLADEDDDIEVLEERTSSPSITREQTVVPPPPVEPLRSAVVASKPAAPLDDLLPPLNTERPPAMPAVAAVEPTLPPAGTRVPTGGIRIPPVELERLRREALARKLGRARMSTTQSGLTSRPPPPQPSASAGGAPVASATSPVPPAPTPAEACESLRRRYEEGVHQARQHRIRKLVSAAQSALARNDWVEAANQYRQAVRYSDDPTLAATYKEVSRRAHQLMTEAYLKQARYEEQAGCWEASAASYLKAHEGRPDDPYLCDRVAHVLRMNKDLHRAAKFGELAVQLGPTNPAFRLTLALVYLDAGLALRARSELEQALKLDPNNHAARELLVKTRRAVS